MKQGIALGCGLLGDVYRSRNELDKAEAMYNKALVMSESLGIKTFMATTYASLGTVYQSRGMPDQARKMYRESLKLTLLAGTESQAKELQARIDGLR